jgi:hypothetical protein
VDRAAAAAFGPPAPRPRRRRVWISLLVGAVVVIVGFAVASGTIWIQKVKPPIDAANDYLREISRGNYEAAFDQLCALEKVDGSPRSLAQTVDALVFSLGDYEVTPFDVRIDGNRATVKADLNPDNVGGTESANSRIRLEKIDGKWHPCGGQWGSSTSSGGTGRSH